MPEPRMLYTCATPGCKAAGSGFTDEPGLHCALCLDDLAGVYDTTGTLGTDAERRAVAAGGEQHAS